MTTIFLFVAIKYSIAPHKAQQELSKNRLHAPFSNLVIIFGRFWCQE
jgi:hypothetical protein